MDAGDKESKNEIKPVRNFGRTNLLDTFTDQPSTSADGQCRDVDAATSTGPEDNEVVVVFESPRSLDVAVSSEMFLHQPTISTSKTSASLPSLRADQDNNSTPSKPASKKSQAKRSASY